MVANKSSGQIGGLYWGSDSLLDLWVSGVLGIDMASSRTGMSTGAVCWNMVIGGGRLQGRAGEDLSFLSDF